MECENHGVSQSILECTPATLKELDVCMFVFRVVHIKWKVVILHSLIRDSTPSSLFSITFLMISFTSHCSCIAAQSNLLSTSLKKVLVKSEHICGNTFSLFYVALDSIILSVIKVRPWKETTMNLEAKFKLKSTNLSFIWTM